MPSKQRGNQPFPGPHSVSLSRLWLRSLCALGLASLHHSSCLVSSRAATYNCREELSILAAPMEKPCTVSAAAGRSELFLVRLVTGMVSKGCVAEMGEAGAH